MRALEYLNKPEYWFRPGQVVRRMARQWGRHQAIEEVRLPWGMRLRIRPGEIIGRAIWQTGLYDLAVSETIARLLQPGDRAIDAGANLGYMTGIMAWRVGERGQVWSFEPHPELVGELRANVELWGQAGAAVRVMAKALGETEGEAMLVQTAEFAHNRGTSSVVGGNVAEKAEERRFPVELTRLDSICSDEARFELLKIDVEGGELLVLKGAAGLLRARRIRQVVFEEHDRYPTPVTNLLEANGYTVFRLVKGLLGPGLIPAGESARGPAWAPPSFLATLDPAGARQALSGRGWRVLGW
jgi:FkbM family methyltransferase